MLGNLGSNKPLIALIGAVVLPLGALLYLAGLPDGGRGSLLAILPQVALVVISVGLFALFLARLVDQLNARRVRTWLESPAGQDWLRALPADEQARFLGRLAGNPPTEDGDEAKSPVDSPRSSR